MVDRLSSSDLNQNRPFTLLELVGTGWPCHHVDMATRDLDRLGARVKSHRLQAYTSRDAAAAAAGITKDTWQRVEEGRPVRESSYMKVDRALGWAVGSCLAIVDGGEPVLAGESIDASAARPSEEELRKLAFEAAAATIPAAPVGEIQAFIERFVKDLRGVGELGDDR